MITCSERKQSMEKSKDTRREERERNYPFPKESLLCTGGSRFETDEIRKRYNAFPLVKRWEGSSKRKDLNVKGSTIRKRTT